MVVKFKIPGPPIGKQRPRTCRINGKSVTYTPRKTKEYENLVRASYTAASTVRFLRDEPLEISITALFSVPKNKSKTQKRLMLSGAIFPTKKPDGDNIVKVILDGLNKVAYEDDAQVCKIHFTKGYAENPAVNVEIKNMLEVTK